MKGYGRLSPHTFYFAQFVAVVSAFFLSAGTARACTAFLQDGLVAGKNYDWHLDDGLLFVNKRGIAKRALLLDPTEKAAEWVSRYGSVTFNQYGREMPNGGVNEAGLVVETLMLPSARVPAPDERPALVSWMQYQLDTSGTVAEVIASDKVVRISPAMPMPVHFFVCDRRGNAAVVEFIEGKQVCHMGDQLVHQLIANDTYADSISFLARHQGFGGTKPIRKGSHNSLDRFVVAAERLKTWHADNTRQSPIQYAFDTLAAVAQGRSTKWSIVYDLNSLEIHYRTERCAATRTVRLADFDFSPQTPVRMIPINTRHTGVLNPHFVDYDADVNRWLIYYCAQRTELLAQVPDALLELLAGYPETTFSK
jgi:penicillin V acylase-like amidase (Ntn superfamily)